MSLIISAGAVLLTAASTFIGHRMRLNHVRETYAKLLQENRLDAQTALQLEKDARKSVEQMAADLSFDCVEAQKEAQKLQEQVRDLEKQLAEATDEREKWKNAAEHARSITLMEVQNLLSYNGTEVGQRELGQ